MKIKKLSITSLCSFFKKTRQAYYNKIEYEKVEKFQEEVEESGLSYEESEVCYYIMYFSSEVERQLKTGDHQIDRGTYMAISQLPDPIRLKMLSNISFLRKKIFEEGYDTEKDYIFKTHQDVLLPKRTGPGEFEGVKVADILGIEPIKLLSKQGE